MKRLFSTFLAVVLLGFSVGVVADCGDLTTASATTTATTGADGPVGVVTTNAASAGSVVSWSDCLNKSIQAVGAATSNALLDDGRGLGIGLGASGGEYAIAAGFNWNFTETWSTSATIAYSQNTPLAAGVGLRWRF